MLADLSTYSLQDFLLFDATIYRGLFGQMTAALWPLALAGIALALVLLGLRRRLPALADQGAAMLLATAFLASAWFFFFGVYRTINFAAVYPGWAFVAQAGLLLLAAVVAVFATGPSRWGNAASPLTRLVAALVVLYGLFGHPAAELATGREAASLEWFALAPDPTALVALGFLASWRSRWRYALSLVPVIWLAASALTLYGLEMQTEALCLALAMLVGLVALVLPRQTAFEFARSEEAHDGTATRRAPPRPGEAPRIPGRIKAAGGEALLPTTRRQ
ncbi:DUF6064 family protein [Jiella pacifica]|uniref:Uncharacterized protein n=1 Tax=Jiella pacifica TaxID=2696469 RepID=A0A6N9T128_9HYPH|nr:DUF6064 family protein [Jiella pacifica]NDW04282.1 hypothetical protein [Jiella pacifica]